MKLTIKKQVHGCFAAASSYDVSLHKVLDVPVVFAGLVVTFGDVEVELRAGSIYWQSATQEFVVYDQEDRELYDLGLKNGNFHGCPDPQRLAKITREYIEAGWELAWPGHQNGIAEALREVPHAR